MKIAYTNNVELCKNSLAKIVVGLLLVLLAGCTGPPSLLEWRDQLLQAKQEAIVQRPLAVVRRINGTYQDDLFLLEPDGSGALRITYTAASEWYPQWSPDGSQIAFLVHGGNDSEIWAALHSINADGSAARQVTDAFAIENTRWLTWLNRPLLTGYVPFVWMANGQQIVFEKPDTQLYVVDVATGTERPLLEPAKNPFRAMLAPVYSSHTEQLAFTAVLSDSKRSDIYILSPDGTITNLTAAQTEPVLMSTWSPDGTQLAFVTLDTLYVINRDGTLLQPLYSGLLPPQELYQAPHWSPDGRHIMWGILRDMGHLDINVIELASGQVHTIVNDSTVMLPVWSTDGMSIAYTNYGAEEFTFALLDANSMPPTSVRQKLFGGKYPAWRP